MVVENGYKQTDLGIIPDDWKILKLGDIGKTYGGLSGKSKDDFMDGVSPYIPFMNIMTNPIIDLNYFDYVNLKAGESQNSALKGDLFFNGSSETPEEVGMCSVLLDDIPNLYLNSFCFGFRIQKELNIDGLYLTYYFRSKEGRKLFYSMAQGATRYNLSKANFNRISIPIPALREQTAISRALSDTDTFINSLEKLIEKKRQIKQGAMQELLKPKEGWIDIMLTDVVDFIHGKAHEQFIVENGRYTVVNSKFVSSEGRVAKFSNYSFLTAKKNDLLTVLSDLPNGKALAKCFFVDLDNHYAVNQRICIWRSRNTDPKFLFYLLNRHPYFLALNDGVSQTHILNHHIKKCQISIPSNKADQENIGQILTSIDEEIRALKTKLEKTRSIKDGMMQNLLTGKIRLI
jgi:type I restriction enzyme S subunit